jgi:hypothetical protein
MIVGIAQGGTRMGGRGTLIPPTLLITELIPVVASSTSISPTYHAFLKNLQEGFTLTSTPNAFDEATDLWLLLQCVTWLNR